MSKHPNLQPWLDYFELLGTYKQKGFLETMPDKHEAYLTRAALYALADTRPSTAVGDSVADITTISPSDARLLASSVFTVARRIRTYSAWLSQQGSDYPSWTFALHVVHEDMPHDLLYTLLLTRRRRWWWPWHKMECVEMIEYGDQK